MITDNKKSKIAFYIFSLFCFLAIGTCFICNFAISKEISWAAYPFTAIPFAWIVATPLLLCKKRNKTFFSLIVFSIMVFPFLYIMQSITPVHGWFVPLGLPLSIIGIITLWVTFILLKLFKFSRWYVSSILVFFYGVIVSTAIRYFVAKFVNGPFLSIDIAINILACIAISALTAIIGYSKGKNGKHDN